MTDEDTPKVEINKRQRVEGPGEAEDESTPDAEKKEDTKTTLSKSSTLKPDVTKDEVASETDDETRTNERQAVDELAQVAADQKSSKNKEKDEATENHVKSLIESKQYFVPIGQVSKRRNTIAFAVILGLILVAGVAALLVMV